MVGFDFNGVVDNMKFTPAWEDVIITGNTIPMVWTVLTWLESHNIHCAVYFNPYPYGANNPYISGDWKAEMINKLGVTRFYEDDPLQCEIIKNCCPNCEVVQV